MLERLKKYIYNSSWLLIENIVRIFSSILIGIWVARHLGPENFGVLSYSVSIISILSILSSLGMDNILIKKIVSNPSKKDEYIQNAFLLKFMASIITFAILLILYNLYLKNEIYGLILMVLSISLIFKSLNVSDIYFQSQVISKYTVISVIISIVITSALKVILIVTEKELIYFAIAILLESVILSLISITIMLRKYKFKKTKYINKEIIISLVKESWPLFLSGFLVILHLRIDVIMINYYLSEIDVGLYSAAVRISEALYIIPTIITASLFPAIIKAGECGDKYYINKIKNLYKFLFLVSLFCALLLSILSECIMHISFGAEYDESSQVLKIHAWMMIFVSMQLISSKWLIAEGMSKIIFYRGLFGFLVNIVLNLLFINKYGITGAAYASILSIFLSVVIFDFVTQKTREHLIIKLSGFVPVFVKM